MSEKSTDRQDRIEDKIIPEQIIEIAIMLTLADIVPFTKKMIIEHLSHLNKDSVNPMIQAMTINAPGGPSIGLKYRKKVFRRVGYGQYELLESVLSPEAKKRFLTAMKRRGAAEVNMLDILTAHFLCPEMLRKLKILSQYGWGFENWFQIEIIVALYDAGFEVTTDGKKELDADLVVNGLGVELRCYQSRFPDYNLERAFVEHPRASIYLFLAQKDKRVDKMKEEITYPFEERELGEGWVLIYVEK